MPCGRISIISEGWYRKNGRDGNKGGEVKTHYIAPYACCAHTLPLCIKCVTFLWDQAEIRRGAEICCWGNLFEISLKKRQFVQILIHLVQPCTTEVITFIWSSRFSRRNILLFYFWNNDYFLLISKYGQGHLSSCSGQSIKTLPEAQRAINWLCDLD